MTKQQKCAKVSSTMVLLLLADAAAVFALKILGVNAWDWLLISAYWGILTVKNAADFIGGAKPWNRR